MAPAPPGVKYPHITIQYCTQCKWMLRAAYFAQELLSTFSSAPLPGTPPQHFTLPAVTLLPATGGVFTVTLYHVADPAAPHMVQQKVLWDRKTDGGFPEAKELKRRVRDVVDPSRGLGHIDKEYGKGKGGGEGAKKEGEKEGEVMAREELCIDCL
ncbi:Rdx family-domain-containing protein [Tirmania nivea]|nr:Rdx family-domain-containing protein [Tirmania nivea]